MNYQTIKLVNDDRGIATITLARAEKHNALNAKMMQEISSACAHLDQNTAIRAVVLAAEGNTFCAGGDLQWMKDQMTAGRAVKIEQATILANMLRDLDRLSKPLIGRIEGNAFGGGIGMMSVCDVVVAKTGIKMALTETKLGLIPATIGPFVLRRMSETYARQVFFSGKTFSTDFGLKSGLVSHACDENEIDAVVELEIKSILATQPNAVAAAKALLQNLRLKTSDEEISLSINALADCWETDEAQTQISAFLKGRS
jgi:methylglutaconyl-CoA hydratase